MKMMGSPDGTCMHACAHVCAVGSGDQAAAAALARIVAPAARRFRPDIILTSAGFDAHWRDPLEKLSYQSATYHALLGGLQGLADALCGARAAHHSHLHACLAGHSCARSSLFGPGTHVPDLPLHPVLLTGS